MTPEQLQSFSKYWQEAEPLLRLYLKNAIFNRSDAQDTLQKTALCAFKKFNAFDPQQPFRAWALGIARYEVLAYLRNHGRRKEVIDSDIAEQIKSSQQDWGDTQRLEQQERQQLLQNILQQLPEKARKLVRLRFYEEKSYEDIAREMGMNPGTVRTAVCRLIAKMRDIVKDNAKEED